MIKRFRYAVFALVIALSACGGSNNTSTQAAGTDTSKYVFCITGYGNAHEGYSASRTNWGVIGYDVQEQPILTTSPWLSITTTTGHKLIVSSQCYYTEDNPKNLDISWQTR